MVEGVWLQRCYEVAAPVWVPRSLGGGLSIRFLFPPPSVARCCCSNTPDPLDSGGSPSLCWTKDMKQHSVHTQAVQPSYSWARLSMLVASLMTKSTCNETAGHQFKKHVLQPMSYFQLIHLLSFTTVALPQCSIPLHM